MNIPNLLKFKPNNSKSKNTIILKQDNKGIITLSTNQYKLDNTDVYGYASTLSWIKLFNNDMCLIKYSPQNVYIFQNQDLANISLYNNFIIPYIGSKTFDIETVKYYFVKFSNGLLKQKLDKKKQTWSTLNPTKNNTNQITLMITPDAKKPHEEVIEGLFITNRTGLEELFNPFSKRLSSLSTYLKLRKFPPDKVNKVSQELIKQEIFKKFVKYADNHETNWALGIDGKDVRIFPAYDFDLCCDVKTNFSNETHTDNGKTDLKSFILQYKDLPWMKQYISDILNNWDINEIFEISLENTGTPIPSEIKTYYKDFFFGRIKELNETYQEIFEKKIEGECLCV